MSTFTILVQIHQKRRDEKYPLVIRLTHRRQKAYLKTEFYVSDNQLDKNNELNDRFLIRQLNDKIGLYENTILKRLGNKVELYSATELKEFLLKATQLGTDRTIDFVAFAIQHSEKIKEKQKSRARRLITTINALIDFFGREKISISEITSKILEEFEDYLLKPHTIKRNNQFGKEITYNKPPLSLTGVRDYMADIRSLFNAAKDKYNDDEKDEILITHYPFNKYKLPIARQPLKRNLKIEMVRSIISAKDIEVNGTHDTNRANLARDVFALSFFLLGMNTVDLYNIDSYENGRLTYKRSKTKDRRQDEALLSVKVEPEIVPLIENYKDHTGNRVFCFYQMYSSHETFNAGINKGLKQVAKNCGITELTTYYARHSWATIARNDCRISKDDVHLALNHVDGKMKVTDLYIAKDWSIIDEANRKVIDYVFEKQVQKEYKGLFIVKGLERKAM